MASTAMRPSCDALCASIGSPTTSPIAKIDGSSVRRCSSTTMKPRASTCTAVRSSPGISEFGRRPTETSTLSNTCSDRALPGRRRARRECPSDTSVMLATFVFSRIRFAIFAIALRQDVDQIAVGAGQQARGHLDDRDLAAQGRVDAAELESDVAAADDEQGFRHVGQVERARGVPRRAGCRAPGLARASAAIRSPGWRARTGPARLRRPSASTRRRCRSTISAMPWRCRTFRYLASCPVPLVSRATTCSLKWRSLSRSIVGSPKSTPHAAAWRDSAITFATWSSAFDGIQPR